MKLINWVYPCDWDDLKTVKHQQMVDSWDGFWSGLQDCALYDKAGVQDNKSPNWHVWWVGDAAFFRCQNLLCIL